MRYKSRAIRRVENAQLDLFADASSQKTIKEAAGERVWREVGKVFRCADCGQIAVSDDHRDICCCGLKLKDGTDLGIRCVYSDNPNEPYQTEIIAKQIDD
ncbi:hypothetical protein [Nitrosomonas sp. Nm132]|uniref:hypothetical protein n=1 Tax=Nitrosomonas sp. Nm132 TaxID=1881053 RepID=UPI000B88A240|nr:hypothetical protein [Nitrosomonas sp. Nm132]